VPADHDEVGETGADTRYLEVISRQAGEWVVRLHGPDLPAEGVTATSRTLGGVHWAVDPLFPEGAVASDESGESFSHPTDIEFELGPEITAQREIFSLARAARRHADIDYGRHGHDAAMALVSQHGMTLADAAKLLGVSLWEASRLITVVPEPSSAGQDYPEALRPRSGRRTSQQVASTVAIKARQTRVLAAEALRETRKRLAPWPTPVE
jgi:hypothetical protein